MQPQDKYIEILQIVKHFSTGLFDLMGNIPHRGRVPMASDLEIIALSCLQAVLTMESEREFFIKAGKILPDLIERIGTRRNCRADKRLQGVQPYAQIYRWPIQSHSRAG